jgi:hypothetical protein
MAPKGAAEFRRSSFQPTPSATPSLPTGTPFGPQEVETMSQIRSPSLARCYGMVRVARVWKISRASVYRSRK